MPLTRTATKKKWCGMLLVKRLAGHLLEHFPSNMEERHDHARLLDPQRFPSPHVEERVGDPPVSRALSRSELARTGRFGV